MIVSEAVSAWWQLLAVLTLALLIWCRTSCTSHTPDGALIPTEALDKAQAALEIIEEGGDGGKINIDATVSVLFVWVY